MTTTAKLSVRRAAQYGNQHFAGILQNKAGKESLRQRQCLATRHTESCSSDYGVHGIDSAYGDAFDLLVVSGTATPE